MPGGRLWRRALWLPVLGVSLAGCITDLNSTRADINDLKQDSFEAKKEIASLKGALASIQKAAHSLKSKTGLAKEESLIAIRDSQTSLYTQVSDTLKEIQNLSGRFEENKYFVDKEINRLAAEVEVLKSRAYTSLGRGEGAAPGDLITRVEALEADIAVLKAKLAAKEAMPAKGAAAKKQGLKPSPGDMYDDAYKTYEAGRYAETRKKMGDLIKDYPNHPLAGNARFWVGESYYNSKSFENAILSYEEVIRKHKGHRKVPAAMLKQALAFLKIGDKKAAKGILGEITQKYPKSPEAKKAKREIAKIR